jgi:hypothetical protein
MATFTDEAGREWNLRLDYSAVRQIRKSLGVDLIDLKGQGAAFARMADDLELLVNVLYLALADQCAAKGITDEEFGRGLAGEAFQEAANALQEAAISFLPPPDREAARRLLTILTGAKAELTASASMSGA